MKVLHINATLTGGAARAALRLHSALLKEGVESYIWVQDRRGVGLEPHILSPESGLAKAWAFVRPYLDKAPILLYPKRKKGVFNLGYLPFSLPLSTIKELKPDIVHLHWIGRGALALRDLAKIKAPLVWSLHDMWAFTGGDHNYPDKSEHTYKHSCILNSPFERDLATWGFKMKQRAYAKTPNLNIVGVSSWICHLSKQSALLKDKPHHNIPNPIDTDSYQPLDKVSCRQLLGLNTSKKLVGFGALDTNDPIKGYDLLLQALRPCTLDMELVVVGRTKSSHLPFKTHHLGALHDTASLVAFYNALDALIVPSRQENLSNMALESLSCGTPVLAFKVGGFADLIQHRENGYIAPSFDTTNLREGLEWVLENNADLSAKARAFVLEHFSEHKVAEQMIALYESLKGGAC
ncbi:glycosyl transferase [Helicobacter sp. NHP19-003]|uniref:Glycosyl transferase n=1 Tax=Helicobacter gastrocanis TaxID=2849641 RepID=A0ABN6I5J7_9HELI|nr:glycosyltransferase [Helicobacter sp. NHP19-003]BCZ16795.1 glycosyl transferase [Helicobacter sp. NHP19-003]